MTAKDNPEFPTEALLYKVSDEEDWVLTCLEISGLHCFCTADVGNISINRGEYVWGSSLRIH